MATDDQGVNVCVLPAQADELFTPLEAWMIGLRQNDIHPDTSEMIMRIDFLRRSHPIEVDGALVWRADGDGMDEDEIRRFARHRMLNLRQWPRPA